MLPPLLPGILDGPHAGILAKTTASENRWNHITSRALVQRGRQTRPGLSLDAPFRPKFSWSPVECALRWES